MAIGDKVTLLSKGNFLCAAFHPHPTDREAWLCNRLIEAETASYLLAWLMREGRLGVIPPAEVLAAKEQAIEAQKGKYLVSG